MAGKRRCIIFLAPSLDVGGAERQLVQSANGLAARGHRVMVALFRATGPLLEELSADVTVKDLEKRGRWDVAGFLLRTARFLRREHPDVLYSYLGVPNLAAVALKVLVPGLRAVWAVRSSDMDLSKYGWLSRACYFLEKTLSGYADHIIFNSMAGKRHAGNVGFSLKRSSVVSNGIDTDRFVPRNEPRSLRDAWSPQDDILVGMVARLDPMKDHATFLQAVRLVVGKDPQVRFVCVGEGPLADELAELGTTMGVADAVTWAGARPDMVAVYNAMDVCVLSSVTEGFPNVLGEAMSCGVPCVATDVGDAALLVGDSGVMVPPRDPDRLAAAILDMVGRVRRGDVPDTRARVKARFSLERMVASTESVLLEKVS